MSAKILLFDIENTPSVVYMWSMYDKWFNEEMIKEPWYILCWSAKWLGSKEIISSALPDFKNAYKKNPKDDKPILQKLWKLLDEADIVVAHNGKAFDVRKVNARFSMNNMKPPSGYKVVDTLLAARQYFYFTSNKLTNLGKYLGLGEKVETGGFGLWQRCMAGDKKAWELMVKYCKNDIVLLEKIYLRLLPYIQNHPNLNVYIDEKELICPNCESGRVIRHGHSYTAGGKYQRYQCLSCGTWFKGNSNLLEIKLAKRD